MFALFTENLMGPIDTNVTENGELDIKESFGTEIGSGRVFFYF